jgi:hypothetical protein
MSIATIALMKDTIIMRITIIMKDIIIMRGIIMSIIMIARDMTTMGTITQLMEAVATIMIICMEFFFIF